MDLTPAAAPNGVDAAMVKALLRALADVQPHWRWLLLTSPETHDLYASLESYNAERQCLAPHKPELKAPLTLHKLPRTRWGKAWRKILGMVGLPRPPHLLSTETVLKHLKADLLFCPLGATQICDSTVPTVAQWHDFSHVSHYQLLGPEAHLAADRTFRETVRVADRVVCHSDYNCEVVRDLGRKEARQVVALRADLLQRLPHLPRPELESALERLGVGARPFLYFPATYAETNNHKLLLVAFGMFRRRHPDSACQLVCNGPGGRAAEKLAAAAKQMGLAAHVLVCRTVLVEEEAALLQGCQAVFLPWLAGNPVQPALQALELSKPILCSDLAGLPEFLREAALLFDPRQPVSLVKALERACDTDLLDTLRQRSHLLARRLGGPRDAARQLVGVFQEVIATFRRSVDSVKGIHPDGWTTERVVVTFASAAAPRTLRLALQSPPWFPWAHQRIRQLRKRSIPGKTYKLRRGQALTIECALPAESGILEFIFDPPMVPRALGLNNDDRMLGCECRGCVIVGPSAQQNLFPPEAPVVVAARAA